MVGSKEAGSEGAVTRLEGVVIGSEGVVICSKGVVTRSEGVVICSRGAVTGLEGVVTCWVGLTCSCSVAAGSVGASLVGEACWGLVQVAGTSGFLTEASTSLAVNLAMGDSGLSVRGKGSGRIRLPGEGEAALTSGGVTSWLPRRLTFGELGHRVGGVAGRGT